MNHDNGRNTSNAMQWNVETHVSEMLIITSRECCYQLSQVRIAICTANTAVMSVPPLCTESAVPGEPARQGEVSGQKSNGVFSVTLGALNPSNLKAHPH